MGSGFSKKAAPVDPRGAQSSVRPYREPYPLHGAQELRAMITLTGPRCARRCQRHRRLSRRVWCP